MSAVAQEIEQGSSGNFRVLMLDANLVPITTGLTIGPTQAHLSKNRGAGAAKNDAGTATHDSRGYWLIPYNTVDSNTAGDLTLDVQVAGALPVEKTYKVRPKRLIDSLTLGVDYVQADLERIKGQDANAAIAAAPSNFPTMQVSLSGEVTAGQTPRLR